MRGPCFSGPFDGEIIENKSQVILLESKSRDEYHQVRAAYVWKEKKWLVDPDLTLDLKKGLLLAKPTVIDLGVNFCEIKAK